jgi:hypothetical protein
MNRGHGSLEEAILEHSKDVARFSALEIAAHVNATDEPTPEMISTVQHAIAMLRRKGLINLAERRPSGDDTYTRSAALS